jgi:hypothetical protein
MKEIDNMKNLLIIIKIKLGMYEVIKNFHKLNPMHKLISHLLKEQIKKSDSSIKLDDLNNL